MHRWRTSTRAFLYFNLLMVGLAVAVIAIAAIQSEFMAGFAIVMLGTGALIFIWPIGAIVLGMAWLVGRIRRR